MATAAKRAFDLNIARAGYFLRIHMALQGGIRGAPVNPIRELPRVVPWLMTGAFLVLIWLTANHQIGGSRRSRAYFS